VLVFRILFQIKQWMNDILQLRKYVMKDIRSFCVMKSQSFWIVMEIVDQIDSLILGFGTVEWLCLLTFWRNITAIFHASIQLNLIHSPWRWSVIPLNVGKFNH